MDNGLHRYSWVDLYVLKSGQPYERRFWLFLRKYSSWPDLLLTKGRGIGGGDVKLMAVSGLMLGWRKNILAFFVGCVLVSFVYLFRRKFLEKQFGLSDSFHRLAFGPYLAAGIVVSMLWGEKIISAYVSWPGLMF